MPESTAHFRFVYVPADISDSLEGWTQEYTEENAVECLFDRIKVNGRAW